MSLKLKQYASWSDTVEADESFEVNEEDSYEETMDSAELFNQWFGDSVLTYYDHGVRTIDNININNVKNIVLKWTGNTPTGTSILGRISLDNGYSWIDVTNGQVVNINPGYQTIAFQNILTTSDENQTPELTDVTIELTQNNFDGNIIPLLDQLNLSPTNTAKWQLEQKQYPTSFVAGERKNETLSIPTAGLSTKEGTFRQWVNVLYNKSEGIQTIIDIPAKNNSKNRGIYLTYDPQQEKYAFQIYNESDTTSGNPIYVDKLNEGWRFIEIKWKTEQNSIFVELYIDNELKGKINNAKMPNQFGNYIYIGHTNGDLFADMVFGNTQLLNRYTNAEDSLIAFIRGTNKLVWEQGTISLYKWDGKLYSGGISGIILTSPSGIRYKLEINDAGAIISTKV